VAMDVEGRNPDSPAGEYFRAKLWAWHPIHSLICQLCSDLLDKDTLAHMGYNDGAGPVDQKTCTEMASRFEIWMEHHVHGCRLDFPDVVQVAEDGRVVTPEELEANPDLKTHNPFIVDDDHLKEWIEFLRHCGGFEVW